MESAEVKALTSNEHISVDNTLMRAWASHASRQRIDGQKDPPLLGAGLGEGFRVIISRLVDVAFHRGPGIP